MAAHKDITKGTAQSLRRDIDGWSPRVLYHRHPERIVDPRIWGLVWWQYFHNDEHCLKETSRVVGFAVDPPVQVADIQIDCAPLPARLADRRVDLAAAAAALYDSLHHVLAVPA